MLSKQQYERIVQQVLDYFKKANIVLTQEEQQRVEVADFGLNDWEHTALQLVTYLNTDRVCAKELVLLPGQTCPEHRHPPFEGYAGKEETFRCRYGLVYLYVEGDVTPHPTVCPPDLGREYYTVFHEVCLHPGEQYTLPINTLHWFTAGPEGAVISEFSTPSFDERDVFTNPAVRRAPELSEQEEPAYV